MLSIYSLLAHYVMCVSFYKQSPLLSYIDVKYIFSVSTLCYVTYCATHILRCFMIRVTMLSVSRAVMFSVSI